MHPASDQRSVVAPGHLAKHNGIPHCKRIFLQGGGVREADVLGPPRGNSRLDYELNFQDETIVLLPATGVQMDFYPPLIGMRETPMSASELADSAVNLDASRVSRPEYHPAPALDLVEFLRS
jgi:hypothetical protein